MKVCCAKCEVELNDYDEVVMDDLIQLRHKECYDYASRLHLIDTVGLYKNVKSYFPAFLLDVYREIIKMNEEEIQSADEITDEEVIEILVSTFGDTD